MILEAIMSANYSYINHLDLIKIILEMQGLLNYSFRMKEMPCFPREKQTKEKSQNT